jgi:hypothetical protein
MTDNFGSSYGEPVTPVEPAKSNKNTVLIVVIVVLVILCCCCVVFGGGAGAWLWNNGDQMFGYSRVLGSLFV